MNIPNILSVQHDACGNELEHETGAFSSYFQG